MSETQNQAEQGEEGIGLTLGFRLFEDEGEMYLAEAEVTTYVDDPNALGATLVFHPLGEVDPTADEDEEIPVWHVDVDDVLTREEGAPVREQFQSIVRQLAGMPESELREYLLAAKEQEGMEDEEA
jgi:hypothetical protein